MDIRLVIIIIGIGLFILLLLIACFLDKCTRVLEK